MNAGVMCSIRMMCLYAEKMHENMQKIHECLRLGNNNNKPQWICMNEYGSKVLPNTTGHK